MLFNGIYEFRGYSKKTTESGKTYYFAHIEDENGESCTFICTSEDYLKSAEKGSPVLVTFDYNSKYNNLRICNVEVK